MMMTLVDIFNRLWKDYSDQNPGASEIYDLFKLSDPQLLNDHVAFRTFNDPRLNINRMAVPFVENGYEPKGSYLFETKHLQAVHFEHKTDNKAPKVFISQLILEDFSDHLQDTIRAVINASKAEEKEPEELLFSPDIFGEPSFPVYDKLRQESEYAAWLYVYGFRANHFTIFINSLTSLSSIEEVNEFLKRKGFGLNDSGGEIKGSESQLLKQSSTVAEVIDVQFKEGLKQIPACYYEFAERFKDKQGKLFNGFIAASADKIFQSTDFYNRES